MKKYFLLFCFIVFFTANSLLAAKKTVSVLYFQNTTKDKKYEWLSKGLADMLISDLSTSSELTVVEREDLQKVLDEQHFSQSGFADNTDAIKLGKLLNSKKIVTGSYIVQKNRVRVDIKVIDTTNGKVESIGQIGNIEELIDIQQKTVRKIFAVLKVEIPINLRKDTDSYLAVKKYYEGISFLDDGKIDLALKKFEEAEKYDPMYDKPQKDMEKAYNFLKQYKKARFHRELSKLFKEANDIVKRMNQKPFLTIKQVVMSEKWQKMNQKQRDEFQKINYTLFKYNSISACAFGLQSKLMDIAGKRDEMIDEIYEPKEDIIENKISRASSKRRDEFWIIKEKEKKIHDEYFKRRKEANEISDSAKRNQEFSKIDKQKNDKLKEVKKEMENFEKFYDNLESKYDKELKEVENQKAAEEAEIAKKNKILYEKIITIADKAEISIPDSDAMKENILYYRILACSSLEDYVKLKIYSERYLKKYPEARMIWAVEDFYERAIEKLSEK